jgi:hypothetical protein
VGDSRTDAFQAEHDQLAQRLGVRASVDHARRAVVLAVGAFAGMGTGWTLFWERYGRFPTERGLTHPSLVVVGSAAFLLAGLALAALCVVSARRWRRLVREEAGLFARLLELRRLLGIDP